MLVIGVHKRYNKATKKGYHPRAKKHWTVYFLDEDLKLHTKRISFLLVPYYKIQKVGRFNFVCQFCGCKFLSMTNKRSRFEPCPNGCDQQDQT